jgi:hypothetical protein
MRERFDGLPLPELVLSAVGMILVLFSHENGLSPVTQQNPAYLLVFVVLCALGAVATLFPRRCSPEIRVTGDLPPSRYTEVLGIRVIHGHHSDCSGFRNHEIRLGGKRICAGCLGLLAGSLIAIFITVTQAIQIIPIPPQSGPLGLAFVAAGLAYSVIIPRSPPVLRSVLNAFLVTGFALVYLVLTSVRGLGLIGISLSIFWMYTRIRLSRWSHDRLCAGCDEPCDEKRVGISA